MPKRNDARERRTNVINVEEPSRSVQRTAEEFCKTTEGRAGERRAECYDVRSRRGNVVKKKKTKKKENRPRRIDRAEGRFVLLGIRVRR